MSGSKTFNWREHIHTLHTQIDSFSSGSLPGVSIKPAFQVTFPQKRIINQQSGSEQTSKIISSHHKSQSQILIPPMTHQRQPTQRPGGLIRHATLCATQLWNVFCLAELRCHFPNCRWPNYAFHNKSSE